MVNNENNNRGGKCLPCSIIFIASTIALAAAMGVKIHFNKDSVDIVIPGEITKKEGKLYKEEEKLDKENKKESEEKPKERHLNKLEKERGRHDAKHAKEQLKNKEKSQQFRKGR